MTCLNSTLNIGNNIKKARRNSGTPLFYLYESECYSFTPVMITVIASLPL